MIIDPCTTTEVRGPACADPLPCGRFGEDFHNFSPECTVISRILPLLHYSCLMKKEASILVNVLASTDAIIHGTGNRQNSKNVLKAFVFNNLLEFQYLEKCGTKFSKSVALSS